MRILIRHSAFAVIYIVFSALPAAAQTVLTVSTYLPPSHALLQGQKDWCAQIEQRSAGNLKCNILPKPVASPAGHYDAIRNGLADVSMTVHSYTPGRFLLTQMAELPFTGNSAESISVAYNRIFARYPAFESEHVGIKVLGVFTHGLAGVFNNKRPVTKIQDLAGLKVRVSGGAVLDVSNALGMNGIVKPVTESYELLSTGVLDGVLLPPESVESFKVDKLVKFVTMVPGGLYNTSSVFMMNRAKYDSLTPEFKKIVDDLSGEAAARLLVRSWDKADRRALATMLANGLQLAPVDAIFNKAIHDKVASVEEKWIQAAEAKGLKNAKQILAEFRTQIAKVE
jgi:TRAP-type transport system periplasmic protein